MAGNEHPGEHHNKRKKKSKTVRLSLDPPEEPVELKRTPSPAISAISTASSQGNFITMEELSTHNKRDDAWIALRGKVYDITFYVNRHPGGLEVIKPYFGKDGTKAFNSIHSYVDFKTILKGHHVGNLETPSPSDKNRKSESFSNTDHDDEGGGGCCWCKKKKDKRTPKSTEFYDSPASVIYEVKFPDKNKSMEEEWCAGIMGGDTLIVKKFVDTSNVWYSSYKLSFPIKSGPQLNFSSNFNTCEIILKKPGGQPAWKSLGTPNEGNDEIFDSRTKSDEYDAYIVYKQSLTHDTNLFGIRVDSAVFGILIGHHVHLKIKDANRRYTPSSFSITGKEPPSHIPGSGKLIWLIIKIYKQGALTSKLDKISVTTKTEGESPLKISSSEGTFDPKFLFSGHKNLLVMFVGGTGITPMTRIIRHILDGGDKSKRIVFIYWNKTEGDIILRDQLEDLNYKERARFYYVPVLTHASPSWKGLSGRPSEPLITYVLENLPSELAAAGTGHKHAVICGSTGFNGAVASVISDQFSKQDYFVFEG